VNLARTLSVAAVDLRTAWRRPLWITLVLLLALFALGFAIGGLRVQAGDVTAGGKQAWINSQFNAAFCDGAVLRLFLPFFAAIACGLPLLQDIDRKVDRVLLGTRLTPLEYVTGRFLGAVIPMLVIVALWVVMQIAFFELWPLDNPEKERGPFALWNYVWPAIVFSVPLLLPMAGGSMLLGSWIGARVAAAAGVFNLTTRVHRNKSALGPTLQAEYAHAEEAIIAQQTTTCHRTRWRKIKLSARPTPSSGASSRSTTTIHGRSAPRGLGSLSGSIPGY